MHPLGRAPTDFERDILNPDLARIVDPESATVARAELGIAAPVTTIEAYELVA